MAKWWQYILNPFVGLRDIQQAIDRKVGGYAQQTEHGEPVESYRPVAGSRTTPVSSDLTDVAGELWGHLTGESQIRLQNELQRQLAEEEYQRNLQSIGDTAAAYEAAGFNRNILYGGSNGSPVGYTAPQLQAYSGSKKLDTILQRTGKVLSMIPAIYQATAALEGIDQARERTKQSEIKTMSMGMNLLDQGYKLGDMYMKKPFFMDWKPADFGDKRHVNDYWSTGIWIPWYHGNGGEANFYKYQDAALKNQFDLLASIGIKNQMNTTLNNWRGYQYSLDRRFGAAGRIVGMASQGTRAVGSLFSPINLFGGKYK